MEKINPPLGKQPSLFNSKLETGVRAVIVLNAAFPRAFDLTELTWLDHLVVHTNDIDGPTSLHPDITGRNGELLVRRRLIEDSLNFMRRLHLVEMISDDRGIAYKASDEAAPLVSFLSTDYSRALKDRAQWLAKTIGPDQPSEVAKKRNPEIDDWLVQFQGDRGPGDVA